MKTAFIISEYDPFHNGHAFMVNSLREKEGFEAVVAVMSGCFTQRGEPASAPKYERAEAAVRGGVNLVLELPFPYSASGAEFFATAGVRIISALGIPGCLAFGSEKGEVSAIADAVCRLESPEFGKAFNAARKDAAASAYGAAALRERLYRELYPGEDASLIREPNNILGIEYLRALKGTDLLVTTVKREGAGHKEGTAGRTASGTALREMMKKDVKSMAEYCPESTEEVFLRAHSGGLCPADPDKIGDILLALFRISEPAAFSCYAEAGGGVAQRLCDSAAKASSFRELIRLAATKRYTDTRLKRAALFCATKITSHMLKRPPAYTTLLACDEKGRRLLREIKKKSSVPIITKPSDYRALGGEIRSAFERALCAEALYCLCLPIRQPSDFMLKKSPFIYIPKEKQ